MEETALDQVPTKKSGIVSRILENESPQKTEAILVIPDKGEVKVVNEVGACIWELIDGVHSVRDIISIICSQYDIEEDKAINDINNFLGELEDRGIIRYISENGL
jgi:hypothetical protein